MSGGGHHRLPGDLGSKGALLRALGHPLARSSRVSSVASAGALGGARAA